MKPAFNRSCLYLNAVLSIHTDNLHVWRLIQMKTYSSDNDLYISYLSSKDDNFRCYKLFLEDNFNKQW